MSLHYGKPKYGIKINDDINHGIVGLRFDVPAACPRKITLPSGPYPPQATHLSREEKERKMKILEQYLAELQHRHKTGQISAIEYDAATTATINNARRYFARKQDDQRIFAKNREP